MSNQGAITTAICLLIFGNLAASLSDVAVKLLNGDVSVFQYVFLRQLLSACVLLPLWLRLNRAQRALTNPNTTLLRAHLILVGSGGMMIAVTHMPLATANAIFYAAPLLMLPLSVLVLKESPTKNKVLLSLIGFLGVLLVLRPSHFHWAALFALGTAMTLAIFNIMARKIPNEQPVLTTLFWTTLLSLPVSAFAALATWETLSLNHLTLILMSAVLILTYNGLAVRAYKMAQANDIAIAEYSGLVFVAIIGWLFFSEIPDAITVLGIMMIVGPLLPYYQLKQQWVRKKNRKKGLLTSTKTAVRQSEEHH